MAMDITETSFDFITTSRGCMRGRGVAHFDNLFAIEGRWPS